MKNTVRIIAALLLVCMLGMTLVACATKLDGTYSATIAGTGVDLTFDGDKVTIAFKAVGFQLASAEGTYSIDGDKITFAFESEDEDVKEYNGTFDFEKIENDDGSETIKIGAFGKFTKQAD